MDSIANKSLDLKGGVLIVGSLFWQDYLYESGDDVRKTWRENRLNLSQRIQVKVPIRYGRKSNGGTYTMTFSNSCRRNRLGTGYLVPFLCNPITTFEHLLQEANQLSKAEGMKGQLVAQLKNGEPWCVVGILFNVANVDKTPAKSVAGLWKQRIEREVVYDHKAFRIGKESPCLKPNGMLSIPWITPIDDRRKREVDGYDFVLATATKPKGYPRIGELVTNVTADDKRYYFVENFKAGITTFQDIAVLNRLK